MSSMTLEVLANTNATVKELLDKERAGTLSSTEALQLEEMRIALSSTDRVLSLDLNLLISEIAELKLKLELNPSDELKSQLAFKQQLFDISKLSAASPEPTSTSLYAMQQETIQRNLKRSEALVGVTVASPKDLADYVQSTVALNPYGRLRACDIEFLDLMLTIGSATEAQRKEIERLKKTLMN